MKNLKNMFVTAAATSMAFLGAAQASVIDSDKMDAHVASVTADITTIAGYGITIVLSIMAVLIVVSLVKRAGR